MSPFMTLALGWIQILACQGNERFHPHTRGDNAEFPGLGDPVADLLCPVWRQLPRYNGIPMLAHEYNDHP